MRPLETGTIATYSKLFRIIRLLMHAAVSNVVINLEIVEIIEHTSV